LKKSPSLKWKYDELQKKHIFMFNEYVLYVAKNDNKSFRCGIFKNINASKDLYFSSMVFSAPILNTKEEAQILVERHFLTILLTDITENKKHTI
jgi:hypothetical protein